MGQTPQQMGTLTDKHPLTKQLIRKHSKEILESNFREFWKKALRDKCRISVEIKEGYEVISKKMSQISFPFHAYSYAERRFL